MEENAFSSCFKLATVIIPNSVTNIGQMTFYSCSGLTNVTFGDSIINIGNYAFRYCVNLNSVSIPNTITNIGDAAFDSCTNLSAISVDGGNSFYSGVDGVLMDKCQSTIIQFPGGKAGIYIVPNSVTRIEWKAFDSCSSLSSVTIPNGVTNTGGSSFYHCTSLTNVNIGNNVNDLDGESFYGCTGLRSIVVDASNPYYCSEGGVLFNNAQTVVIKCPGGFPGAFFAAHSG